VSFGSLPRQRAVFVLDAPVGMAKLPMRSNPIVVEGINRAPRRTQRGEAATKEEKIVFTTKAQRGIAATKDVGLGISLAKAQRKSIVISNQERNLS